MDLDKIAAGLRPRTGFAAVDLGFLLAQRFARPLWSAFALSMLPFLLAAWLVCMLTDLLWWPLIALWWLRPLYARAVLFVLGRAFFGELPSPLVAAHHSVMSLLRPSNLGRNLGELTVYRLSPFRNFALPVRELEGQRGVAARARTRHLLDASAFTATLLLHTVAILVELTFIVAGLVLLFSVLPDEYTDPLPLQLARLFSPHGAAPLAKTLVLGAYALLVAALEPLLVAGTFSLYVNRRVDLEGWDIELSFRRLARRLEAGSESGADAHTGTSSTLTTLVGTALGAALALALTGAPAPTLAQAPPSHDDAHAAAPDDGAHDDGTHDDDTHAAHDDGASQPVLYTAVEPDPQQLIATILEAPEYGQTRIETKWRFRTAPKRTPSPDTEHGNDVSGAVAGVLRVVLWALAWASLVVALFYIVRYLRRKGVSFGRDIVRAPASARVEVVPDAGPAPLATLPGDLLGQVRRAWEAGDDVGALSLLYAGTLQALRVRHGIAIDPSQTPYECVGTVRARGGPHELVAQVARAWTALAFARRAPDDGEFSALLTSWQRVFGAQPFADGDVR